MFKNKFKKLKPQQHSRATSVQHMQTDFFFLKQQKNTFDIIVL